MNERKTICRQSGITHCDGGTATPPNAVAARTKIAISSMGIDLYDFGIGIRELGIGVAPIGIVVSVPVRILSSVFSSVICPQKPPELLAGHHPDILQPLGDGDQSSALAFQQVSGNRFGGHQPGIDAIRQVPVKA